MRPTAHVRALLALVVTVTLGGTLLSAPAPSQAARSSATVSTAADVPAPAQHRARCKVPNCWVALSFNTKTGYSGRAPFKGAGVRTRKAAMQIAHKNCRSRPENSHARGACQWPDKRNTVVRDNCVAIAFRTRGGNIVEWAKGISYGHIGATRRAKRVVNDGPGEVRISHWVCGKRRKVN